MKKTVAELIALGRDKAQRWDLNEVPDGYPDEDGEFAPGVTALRIVQGMTRKMTATGFNQCWFEFPLVAQQRSYLMTRRMGTIRRAILVSSLETREWPIHQTSEKYLDEQMPGWNQAKSTRPLHYFYTGTKSVGFYPLPISAQYTAKFLADTPIAEPTLATDIIGGLLDASDDPLIDGDGIQASVVPDELLEAFTSGIASELCRAGRDWPGFGSFGKEWKEGLDLLKSMAQNRIGKDLENIIVDTSGRLSAGVNPRW